MTDDDYLVHADERSRMKGEYKILFEAVSTILFRYDPIGLDFEENIDEYDPEVAAILPRLRDCRSAADVQRVAHEEFVRLFDADLAGPPERYLAIAADIWALWSNKPLQA